MNELVKLQLPKVKNIKKDIPDWCKQIGLVALKTAVYSKTMPRDTGRLAFKATKLQELKTLTWCLLFDGSVSPYARPLDLGASYIPKEYWYNRQYILNKIQEQKGRHNDWMDKIYWEVANSIVNFIGRRTRKATIRVYYTSGREENDYTNEYEEDEDILVLE